MPFWETAKRFLRDRSGTPAIEYGLIAAGILLGIVSTLAATKGKLIATFTTLHDTLK